MTENQIEGQSFKTESDQAMIISNIALIESLIWLLRNKGVLNNDDMKSMLEQIETRVGQAFSDENDPIASRVLSTVRRRLG